MHETLKSRSIAAYEVLSFPIILLKMQSGPHPMNSLQTCIYKLVLRVVFKVA